MNQKTIPKIYAPVSAKARQKAAREKADGFMAKNRKFRATLRAHQGAWMVDLKDLRSFPNPLTLAPALTIGEARQLQSVLGPVLDAYDGRHDL